MKKIVVGLVVCASSLAIWSVPASATLQSQCRAGNRSACRQYAFNRCVDSMRAQGYSRTAAERACR